jgi:hypothetical protein
VLISFKCHDFVCNGANFKVALFKMLFNMYTYVSIIPTVGHLNSSYCLIVSKYILPRIFRLFRKGFLNLFFHCLTILSIHVLKTVGHNVHHCFPPSFTATIFPLSEFPSSTAIVFSRYRLYLWLWWRVVGNVVSYYLPECISDKFIEGFLIWIMRVIRLGQLNFLFFSDSQ